MFRVEVIDYIIKFNVFSKIRYYVKLENIEVFFISFIYSRVCAREKRFSEHLFKIMYFLNNSISDYRESNIKSAKQNL